MSDQPQPLLQSCPGCGAQIDVSEEEPFAQLHCEICGTGMRAQRNFDHFEMQEILGVGGMGAVYRALDANLSRMVAVKLLRKEFSSNPDFVRQFRTEAAVTSSINHPHVVKVYSSGTDHQQIYIAMELVDKGSLDELMNLQGRVSETQVLDVGIQIAQGLHAALQSGLIHRDIKPSNILFYDAHTAKIVDFGLAALMDDAGKVSGEVWGTPFYVAPEKLDGRPEDARSDIYSLGATLFHALAGRPPFDAETNSMAELKQVKSQTVKIETYAPEVSSATAFLINKSLSNDPKKRHQTYEELIEHLRYARNEIDAKAHEKERKAAAPVVVAKPTVQGQSNWLTYAIIAAVVICGAVVLNSFDRSPKESGGRKSFFGTEPTPGDSVETRYTKAREKLFAGQYAEAASALNQIDEEADVPQPLHNWVSLYCGLAHMLSGQNSSATTSFARIQERGLYSTDASEKKLSNFFVEIAGALVNPAPVPSAMSRKIDPASPQSLALLLFAIKNWELEKFDDAEPLFRSFTNAAPQGPALWIGEESERARLKDVANKYLNDYRDYLAAIRTVKAAGPGDKKKAPLAAIKALRASMKAESKLAPSLDKMIAEVEPEVLAWEEAQRKKVEEQNAADTKALAEAKQKRLPLLVQFRFNEARQAILAPRLKYEQARTEQELLGAKLSALAQFKSTLIQDLNTVGYAPPVVRRNGAQVPGGVTKADEQQVHVRTQFGFMSVAWTDLTLDCICAMAHSFLRLGTTTELAATRKWNLGAFEMFVGKAAEGRTMLTEASQLRPDYNSSLQAFLQFNDNP